MIWAFSTSNASSSHIRIQFMQVSELWTSGGSNPAECTRNMLRRMVTLDFAAEICYSGHNEKKKIFKSMALSRLLNGAFAADVIYATILSNVKNYSLSEADK